jgi:hypothetical protein
MHASALCLQDRACSRTGARCRLLTSRDDEDPAAGLSRARALRSDQPPPGGGHTGWPPARCRSVPCRRSWPPRSRAKLSRAAHLTPAFGPRLVEQIGRRRCGEHRHVDAARPLGHTPSRIELPPPRSWAPSRHSLVVMVPAHASCASHAHLASRGGGTAAPYRSQPLLLRQRNTNASTDTPGQTPCLARAPLPGLQTRGVDRGRRAVTGGTRDGCRTMGRHLTLTVRPGQARTRSHGRSVQRSAPATSLQAER